jgi:predicted DNA-binding transcriptional regulator YafY
VKIDRLLSIVIILLNRDTVPATALAKRFGVSVRTVYRDVDTINAAGIPIVSSTGSRGGFGILKDFKLDRHTFALNDMKVMLLALKGMKGVLPDRDADAAYEKLRSLVPRAHHQALDAVDENVVVDVLPWWSHEREKEKLRVVQTAIAERRLLSCVHRASGGETTSRRIEPMTLVLKGYAWYLHAYCRMRNDTRLFRLSRMRELILLEETFVRRNRPYIPATLDRPRSSPGVKLTLRLTGRAFALLEEYFDDAEMTRHEDGGWTVTSLWPDGEWTYATLLGHGAEVEVLHPAAVREEMVRRVDSLALVYNPDILVSHPGGTLLGKRHDHRPPGDSNNAGPSQNDV